MIVLGAMLPVIYFEKIKLQTRNFYAPNANEWMARGVQFNDENRWIYNRGIMEMIYLHALMEIRQQSWIELVHSFTHY